ncbi:MAG: phosphatidylserine/phosphatidylglycerophosphate/cardiolipin synthase family protein [Candidatus Riflebacteria bacterium]|nr:phosphatidylserine/phosphatidylglycerophosphate/cardiolipin synthase family protein [Candidatus Riflebacteria bacterium]
MKRLNVSSGYLIKSFLLLICLVLIVSPSFSANEVLPVNEDLNDLFVSLHPAGDPAPAMSRLITDNAEAWYARWKMFEMAKKSIDCTYFIVDQDIFGKSFLGLIRKKAREGLKIRLMIDDRFLRGAKKLSDYDELDEIARFKNVQIKIYNPIPKAVLKAVSDFRTVMVSNHDKIILIDDELSMVGGRNIGKDYFVQYGEFKNVFSDMDIVINSKEVAKSLRLAFEEEWESLRNSFVKPDLFNLVDQTVPLDLAYRVMNRYLMQGDINLPEKLDVSDSLKECLIKYNSEIVKYKQLSAYSAFNMFQGEHPKKIKIIDKHSMFGPKDDISGNILKMIDKCKHEILIQNAYVVLDIKTWAALKRASERGVKIIINTNSGESTNHGSTVAFFLNDWKNILSDMPTARILVFPKGERCLHTKAFVFDQQFVVAGTYNLDPLSQVINSEVMAVINDKGLARKIAGYMDKDFARCLEYKIEKDSKGNIKVLFGPEDHTSEEVMKKLNFMRKIQWIRPLI